MTARGAKKPTPKKASRVAANSGETEPMAILKNARHELFAQNLAMGMSATEAYAKVLPPLQGWQCVSFPSRYVLPIFSRKFPG